MKISKLKIFLVFSSLYFCYNPLSYANIQPSTEILRAESKLNPQNVDLSHGSTINLEANKKLVENFYTAVFEKHQVKSASERYLTEEYIQHNPLLPDGRKPFIDFFSDYFKRYPLAKNEIKHIFADGDFVILHVLSKQHPKDRGLAIVDIFKVQDGKIVEHWDVIQAIPETAKNNNSMF